MSGCIGHQSSHTGQLFDLLIGTTGSGVSHHEDVVVFIKSGKKCMCQFLIGLFPGFNNLFVTLFLSDKTTFILFHDTVNSILCIFDHLRFLRRYGHIGNGYGHSCSCGIFVTHSFYGIKNFCCLCCTMDIDYFFQNLFILFLCNEEIYFQF